MKKITKLADIKYNAKSLYIMAGLDEAMFYLDAKVEAEVITENEADAIINAIAKDCSKVRMAEIENIRSSVIRLGKACL